MPPVAGAYTRSLRFGEWISEPVTPLFESWLLTTMEERLHDLLWQEVGQRVPRPYHVVVHGWYFYSIGWMSLAGFARSLPTIAWKAIRAPRSVAGILPPTVRYSVAPAEHHWREEVLPRYQAAVAHAENAIDALPVSDLPALIDELAELAGEYFTWIAALAGAAYKMEINLARFYRRHLTPSLGGSHLSLVSGFEAPTDVAGHAVVSLDWWYPPRRAAVELALDDHRRLVEARQAAEEAAFRALAGTPGRLRKFERLLAETQRLVPLREEQVRDWTLPWPAMRNAVVRIGQALTDKGLIGEPDDVFFLSKAEILSALSGSRPVPTAELAARRARRLQQAGLVPPLFIGNLDPLQRWVVRDSPQAFGAVHSSRAIVSGTPASPGRASGQVRVIRGPDQFDELLPGEILVAPLTAPAWTPLFERAAAVVTDVGSGAAHASIIAREYGIPAVVGCGDATARLSTGLSIVVDGAAGTIEPA